MGVLQTLVEQLDPVGGLGPGDKRAVTEGPPGPILPQPARPSAVLALLTSAAMPELLFTERAHTLRRHAGQVSFPGGRIDPDDATPEDAALREACEEVGLDRRRVRLLGRLPVTPLIRAFNATIVVASWEADHRLTPEPSEVAQVLSYRLDVLAGAEVRRSARHPRGGVGPAFVLDDIVVWGFTAHVTDRLLDLGGWATDWDRRQVVEVPRRFLRD